MLACIYQVYGEGFNFSFASSSSSSASCHTGKIPLLSAIIIIEKEGEEKSLASHWKGYVSSCMADWKNIAKFIHSVLYILILLTHEGLAWMNVLFMPWYT